VTYVYTIKILKHIADGEEPVGWPSFGHRSRSSWLLAVHETEGFITPPGASIVLAMYLAAKYGEPKP
jgi:hypothetical protein